MVKSSENLVGAWAFLIGVVLAVIIGLANSLLKEYVLPTSNWPYTVLFVLGLIIGFLNVGDKDSMTFLLASVSLVIVSGFGQDMLVFSSTIPILGALHSILSALRILFHSSEVLSKDT